MHDFVRKMIDELDAETAAIGSGRSIVLFGDRESQYLKAIDWKAKALGLDSVWDEDEAMGEIVPVLDLECRDDSIITSAHYYIDQYNDIDCVEAPGPSCCADACSRIVQHEVRGGSLVAITGRGHAAQGLSRFLSERSYSPLIVHSESDRIAKECVDEYADAIVHTSDRIVFPRRWRMDADTLLDVCGSLERYNEWAGYFSAREIGALNISILLRRFVEV